MGLEELTFDVEGIKLYVKPELHLYHQHPDDEPFIGIVPVRIEYGMKGLQIAMERNLENDTGVHGDLRYDLGEKRFITALSDFVVPVHLLKLQSETDPDCLPLLEKYNQGMAEVSRVYSTMLGARSHPNNRPIITERNFYRNSAGEWKDIGNHWLDVYRDDELKAMADAVK